jgi:CMD domain protein
VTTTDTIDRLAGVLPGSELDAVRHRREQTRENAQASYHALFIAPDQTGVEHTERVAVAAFVAALHADTAVHDHYRRLLAKAGGEELADLVDEVATAAAGEGPYGHYPATADLRGEDAGGLVFRVDAAAAATLGDRLTAALEHAHLLVFRVRESSPEALEALLGAGWSASAIVTLSQIVAFLTFQLRVVHGLRVLKGSAP